MKYNNIIKWKLIINNIFLISILLSLSKYYNIFDIKVIKKQNNFENSIDFAFFTIILHVNLNLNLNPNLPLYLVLRSRLIKRSNSLNFIFNSSNLQ